MGVGGGRTACWRAGSRAQTRGRTLTMAVGCEMVKGKNEEQKRATKPRECVLYEHVHLASKTLWYEEKCPRKQRKK